MFKRLRSFFRRRKMLRVPTRWPFERFMFFASKRSNSAQAPLRSKLPTHHPHISTATVLTVGFDGPQSA